MDQIAVAERTIMVSQDTGIPIYNDIGRDCRRRGRLKHERRGANASPSCRSLVPRHPYAAIARSWPARDAGSTSIRTGTSVDEMIQRAGYANNLPENAIPADGASDQDF